MYQSIIVALLAAAPLPPDVEPVYGLRASGTLSQRLPLKGELHNAQLDMYIWVPFNTLPVEFEIGFARYDIPNGGFTIGESVNGEFDGCYQFPNGAGLGVYNNYLGLFDFIAFGGTFPEGFIAGTNSTAFYFILGDPTQSAVDSTELPTFDDLSGFSDNQSYMGVLNVPGPADVLYDIVGPQATGGARLPGDFDHDGDVDNDDFVFFVQVFCGGNILDCDLSQFTSVTHLNLVYDLYFNCNVNLQDFAEFQNRFGQE